MTGRVSRVRASSVGTTASGASLSVSIAAAANGSSTALGSGAQLGVTIGATADGVLNVYNGVTLVSPTLWNQAIVRSNTTVIGVDVFDGATKIGRVYPKSGSVTADFVTGVRRNLTATFLPSDAALLYPGVELRPYSGFHYGTGAPETVPLGQFPLTANNIGIASADDIQVTCQDKYQWIVGSTFLTPWSSSAGRRIRDMLSQLVTDTGMWSASQVVNTISSVAAGGVQTWDSDRSQAIGDLCKAVGAEAFVDRFGNFVLRDRKAKTTPKVTLATGDGQRIIEAAFALDTSAVYNVVTIIPANTDPAFYIPPVTVRILDPNHPAYPRPGKVLTRPYRLDSALFTTQAQATAAAQKILTRISAVAEQGTLLVMPDASLDEGDTVTVALPSGVQKTVQLQQVTYPLTTTDDQSITTVSTRSDEDFNP